MKKTSILIENRMMTHLNKQKSKLDAIEARLAAKNVELKKKIQDLEKCLHENYLGRKTIRESMKFNRQSDVKVQMVTNHLNCRDGKLKNRSMK